MKMIYRNLIWCAVALSVATTVNAQGNNREIMGTIVSVRGNILHIRPSLRPKLARILVSENTEVIGNRKTDRSFLQPGMRIRCGGQYSEKGGLHLFWAEASRTPIGQLKNKVHGITPDGGWATAGGTLKTLDPFVFVDDDGKEFTADATGLQGVWEDFPMERNGLLIGTRLFANGTLSPDGVLQAETVSPERDQSASGTMYGTITKVTDTGFIVRPRYTQEGIIVKRTPHCVLQREIRLDPDAFKIGDIVTFWGQKVSTPPGQTKSMEKIGALALLVGEGRYPASNDPTAAGVFLTGKLASLEPVTLVTREGKRVEIIVPAQMPIAKLATIKETEIKAGTQVMMVLSPSKNDTFEVSHIIIDASPWVGYGG